MGFKKLVKKVGKVVKKAAPYALGAYGLSQAFPSVAKSAVDFFTGTPEPHELGTGLTQNSAGTYQGSTTASTGNWNPITQGAATLLGGMMTNTASAKQASQQMDYQANMSNTAHQREVADLKAAGLNPILSGTGGMGASSPSGASAPVVDALGSAVGSAQEARTRNEQIQNIRAQTALAGSQESYTGTQESNSIDQNKADLAVKASTVGLNTAKTASEIAESKIKDAGATAAGYVNRGFGAIDRMINSAKSFDIPWFSNPGSWKPPEKREHISSYGGGFGN